MNEYIVCYRYQGNDFVETLIGDSISEVETFVKDKWSSRLPLKLIFVEELGEVKHQLVEDTLGYKCFLWQ